MPSYIDRKTLQLAKYLHLSFKNLSSKFNIISKSIYKFIYMWEFGQELNDIYVVTYPKSGTTLMQMMLYQATTDGNMDFINFNDVSPWPTDDIKKGLPVRKKIPTPRIIKNHNNYHSFDKPIKGKIIYVYRNGMDVALSLYHQNRDLKAWNYKKDFSGFMRDFLYQKNGNWFSHIKGWMENKNNLSILYIKYEDILRDFDGSLTKVCNFCNITIKPQNIERIRERCSFNFMKKYNDKFGEPKPKNIKKNYSNLVRKGKAGEGKKKLNTKEKEQMAKKTEQEFKLIKPELRPDFE